jgi:hypothetical protein
MGNSPIEPGNGMQPTSQARKKHRVLSHPVLFLLIFGGP